VTSEGKRQKKKEKGKRKKEKKMRPTVRRFFFCFLPFSFADHGSTC